MSAEKAHALAPRSIQVPASVSYLLKFFTSQVMQLLACLRMRTDTKLPVRTLLHNSAMNQDPNVAHLIAMGMAEEAAAVRGDASSIKAILCLYSDAIHHIQQLSEKVPFQLWNNFGVFHLVCGNVREALAAFAAAVISLEIITANLVCGLSTCIRSHIDLLLSAVFSKASRAIIPTESSAAFITIASNVADLHVSMGSLAAARYIATSVLKLRPSHVRSHLHLAISCRGSKQGGDMHARLALTNLLAQQIGSGSEHLHRAFFIA